MEAILSSGWAYVYVTKFSDDMGGGLWVYIAKTCPMSYSLLWAVRLKIREASSRLRDALGVASPSKPQRLEASGDPLEKPECVGIPTGYRRTPFRG